MHRLSEMSDAQCMLEQIGGLRQSAPEQESGIGQLRQRGFEVRSASDVIDEFKAELTPENGIDVRELFGSSPEPVEARDQRGVQGRGNAERGRRARRPKPRLADPPDRRTGAGAAYATLLRHRRRPLHGRTNGRRSDAEVERRFQRITTEDPTSFGQASSGGWPATLIIRHHRAAVRFASTTAVARPDERVSVSPESRPTASSMNHLFSVNCRRLRSLPEPPQSNPSRSNDP